MKNVVKTNKAPGAIGPYSQGINVGDLYFFSMLVIYISFQDKSH